MLIIRFLLLCFCFGGLPYVLSAQGFPGSADASEAYLQSLYFSGNERVITNGADSLTAVIDWAKKETDVKTELHATGWFSYYLSFTGRVDSAMYLCEQAVETAQKAGIADTDLVLSFVNFTLSQNTTDTRKKIAYLDKAMVELPVGSRADFLFKTVLIHTKVNICASDVDSLLESLLPIIKSLPPEVQPALLNTEYYGKKAYYHEQCTGNLEQAEVMRRKSMDYHRDNWDAPYGYLWWVDAMVRIASLNALMDRRPVVDELLAVLDTIELGEVAPHVVPYLNMANRLRDVYDYVGDFARAETVMLEVLEYANTHKEQTNQKTYIIIYESLRKLYYENGYYDKAWEMHQSELMHNPGYSRYHGTYSVLIPNAKGEYSAAKDSAIAFLQQICEDCSPGQLPTIKNQLLEDGEIDYYAGETYKMLGLSHYLLEVAKPLPGIKEIQRGADYISQGQPFVVRDYFNLATFEEGVFYGGEELRDNHNLLSLLYAHMAQESQQDGHHAAAFINIENSKANALKPVLASAGLPAGFYVQEADMRHRLGQLEVAVATLEGAAKSAAEREFLELSDAYRNLIMDTRAGNALVMEEAFLNRSISLDALQSLLATDEQFINYNLVRTINKSYLVTQVIGQQSVKTYHRELAENIKEQISSFLKQIQSPLQTQTSRREQLLEQSKAIYDILIAPIKQDILPSAKLVICPSEALSFLPFELLIPSVAEGGYEQQDFLLRQHPISYHYSATSFAMSKQRLMEGEGLLAIAPVFKSEKGVKPNTTAFRSAQAQSLEGMRDGIFDPLPATEEEVLEVAGLHGGLEATILLGLEAEKKAILRAFQRPHKIVHIATHGFVNEKNSDLSALGCYNQQGEGAFIYANDFKNLKLSADLVILSSCESGIGREADGEGVLALNRAFFAAGARNVISTLWKIDDRLSSGLMIDFHRQLAGGKSYPDALRKAKLAFLDAPKTAAPRYWAPFVLVGE